MGFLEISGAEFGRRDLRCNGKHGHARPLTIEQAIDQVQIAGAAASRTDREFSRQVRLGAGCERSDLLVPHMHPFDLALAANRIGQPIEAVADDAIDPLDARGSEGFCKLISNCLGHNDSLLYARMREVFGVLGGESAAAAGKLVFSTLRTCAVSALTCCQSTLSSISEPPYEGLISSSFATHALSAISSSKHFSNTLT